MVGLLNDGRLECLVKHSPQWRERDDSVAERRGAVDDQGERSRLDSRPQQSSGAVRNQIFGAPEPDTERALTIGSSERSNGIRSWANARPLVESRSLIPTIIVTSDRLPSASIGLFASLRLKRQWV